jgi:hypothetical protein
VGDVIYFEYEIFNFMIRKFLKNNVAGRSPTNQNPRKQNQPEAGSTSHIAEWLLILEK